MLNIIVSLSPSILFLFCLRLLDSYKLVKLKTVTLLLICGFVAAAAAYFININLIPALQMEGRQYSRFIAPPVEEILKASFIVFFLLRKRIAFIVDSAIFGFSVGTGFALLENIYYLNSIGEADIFIWIIRGFGTAIMHGCTAAVYSILIKYYSDKYRRVNLFLVLFLLIIPAGIHAAFNSFVIPPFAFSVMQLLAAPLIFYAVFYVSEKQMKNWLELSLESNHELLNAINEGILLKTKAGEYLRTLRSKFSSLVLADLICYIRLYIELSMLSKGLLIMKEVGIGGAMAAELKSKLGEIKYLEKKIGFTGRMAVQPLIYNEKGIEWMKNFLTEL